ncbi:uncharacterized protein LOC124186342 isoform X1 [Neodiprion fabricii]|uniref:uncharacterized protein LOC124186342 isoform X1 n=1 Tax=Neodiprion fabricii TaxID=2872261 RepID=UPI001ED8DB0D|nr:uncharacterized protein LOC124186342 isoform X1 [Neodiprion fabricii]
MMANKGWRVVQAHIPMIKFRKGDIERAVRDVIATNQSTGPASSPLKTTSRASGPGVVTRPVIEDFQLPARYQRRPLDIKEIECINVGGLKFRFYSMLSFICYGDIRPP